MKSTYACRLCRKGFFNKWCAQKIVTQLETVPLLQDKGTPLRKGSTSTSRPSSSSSTTSSTSSIFKQSLKPKTREDVKRDKSTESQKVVRGKSAEGTDGNRTAREGKAEKKESKSKEPVVKTEKEMKKEAKAAKKEAKKEAKREKKEAKEREAKEKKEQKEREKDAMQKQKEGKYQSKDQAATKET